MPWMTGLARVARKTGYPVVEVSGWKRRGHGPQPAVKTIVAHHTAGARTGNYPSLRVVRDGRAGLPGPLSHYGIGRDGTIYVIAAGRSWHTGRTFQTSQNNNNAIGIEAENTGTGQTWPAAQLDSYVKLCKALIDEFKLPVSAVQGHKEIASPRGRKIDPNFSNPSISMTQFRNAVKAGSWARGVAPSSSQKKATQKVEKKAASSKNYPTQALKTSNKHTTASHNAWVLLMSRIGYKDKNLGLALQKWLRKLGYYKGSLDGKFGPLSVRALQRFLASKGLYKGAIDGKRQSMTVSAEIAYLNSQRRYL